MRSVGACARVAVAALAFAACDGGGGSGSGSAEVSPEPEVSLEAHVLQRTAYGPDAWTRERIAALGVDAYLEEQLHPASIPDDALEARLALYPALGLELAQLRDGGLVPGEVLDDLRRARLLRSVFSHRQLEQELVDFWFDHFNVFGGDGFAALAIAPYERRAIRPHVLGRFADMLHAVARNGAMLFYLDNDANQKEGFVYAGQPRGLNENYARELLELHTVGLEAGFTQADVIDMARAFTGWTSGFPDRANVDGFSFWSLAHDEDAKRVMDLQLPPGGGIRDGLALLDYLAAHPKTAARVCAQLATRFVSEQPLPRLVEECAGVFRSSGGDLAAVTRAILFSPEFRDPANRSAKVKRPLVLVASLLRATGASPGDDTLDTLVSYLFRLGEAPYMAFPPTGYPDASSHWSAGGTLLVRFELMSWLCGAHTPLGIDWSSDAGSAPELVDRLAARLLAAAPSRTTRDAVVAQLESFGPLAEDVRARRAAALLLSAPESMRH